MIVLRMLYVGGFDAVFVDDVKQLISTPDFKHILYDAIVGLFYFFDYIPNIIFVHDIPGSVQLQLLNKFNPFFYIDFADLAENLQCFLVDNHSFQKNI